MNAFIHVIDDMFSALQFPITKMSRICCKNTETERETTCIVGYTTKLVKLTKQKYTKHFIHVKKIIHQHSSKRQLLLEKKNWFQLIVSY